MRNSYAETFAQDKMVSVIVPVYKVEKYLSRAIDSILSQTYRNLEIILVDDGSPDACGKICDNYAKNDGRVVVLHKENGGLSDARNAGLVAARGEYITFIDSDDWVHSEYLNELFGLLHRYDADIAVSDYLKMYEYSALPEDNTTKSVSIYSNIEALDKLCFGPDATLVTISCGKLYRKSIFKNIRFPEGKVHEDEYVAHRVLFSARKVVVTGKKLYYYLQRADSIMGDGFRLSKRRDLIEAYLDRLKFFTANDLDAHKVATCWNLFLTYKNVLKHYSKNNISKEGIDDIFDGFFLARHMLKDISIGFCRRIQLERNYWKIRLLLMKIKLKRHYREDK